MPAVPKHGAKPNPARVPAYPQKSWQHQLHEVSDRASREQDERTRILEEQIDQQAGRSPEDEMVNPERIFGRGGYLKALGGLFDALANTRKKK